MTTNTTAQIATFLNVSPNQIKSVTEMAWVFCVVVKGCRARFVSKKIIKVENMTELTTMNSLLDMTEEEYQANFQKALNKFELYQLRNFSNPTNDAKFFCSRIDPLIEAKKLIESAKSVKVVNQPIINDYYFGAADEESF